MIILSKDEYLEVVREMNKLIQPGYNNLSYEHRVRYNELDNAASAWEKDHIDEIVEEDLKKIEL